MNGFLSFYDSLMIRTEDCQAGEERCSAYNPLCMLPYQATGELDDAKLVDGVTGEKMIYRKRIEPDVPAGSLQCASTTNRGGAEGTAYLVMPKLRCPSFYLLVIPDTKKWLASCIVKI
eukprot:1239470-Amphidinium_carterae.1